MFEVVHGTKHSRRSERRDDILLGSVALHALIIAGMVYLPAPSRPDESAEAEEAVEFYEVEAVVPLVEAPREPVRTSEGGPAAATVVAVRPPSTPLTAPQGIPSTISDIPLATLAPTLELATTGVDSAASVATKLISAIVGTGGKKYGPGSEGESEEPILVSVLPKPPALVNRNQMERIWKLLYPRRLNSRGVQGQSLVMFIIDTKGRVEPTSIVVLSCSHPDFEAATVKGTMRLRFRPANLNGRPVRVRATLPVAWTLRES